MNIDNKTRNNILLVLFVGVLMGALDIAIVGPALPTIRNAFGVDDRSIAWVFAIYVLFTLISVQLMAKLSDVFGRRSVYVLDVALFALGSLMVSLSPSFEMVLAGRAVQGLGAGGVFPVASAVIGDTFPPDKRGSALGLIGAVFGIAFLIGPVLAGVMLKFLPWQWLFIVNLPIALIVIIAAMRLLPSAGAIKQKSFDFVGIIVLSVGLAALAYGINQMDTKQFASLLSMNVLPFLVIAVVSVPTLIYIERRAENPIIDMNLFRSRQVAVVSLVAGGAGFAESSIAFVPALLVAAFSVTNSDASFMLLPSVLAMAVGSPMAGKMLDKYGSRTVLLVGSGLTAAGMFVVTLASSGLVFFYAAAILIGLGLGALLGAPLRYVMLSEASAAQRAAAQGILTLNTSVGQLVGGALVGAVAASFGGGISGYATAFLAVGIVMAVTVVLTLGLKGQADEKATAEQHHAAAQMAQGK
jgi:EmrB/QacA subfamily drug resistance transporter